ncbi:MAG: triose-phosphate isomerase, partial [Rhodospirillales bacterium]|nr:triose-phosphate isomerase [Rhodospirillales bacterium]
MPGKKRPVWIGTGWKMNKTRQEGVAYADALRSFVRSTNIPANIFIVPPFTALAEVCGVLAGAPIHVGAQNAHWEDAGAFTGEIACPMIADCGATIVELGHSERRSLFNETDQTVNWKVKAAVRNGLKPLICVGENADQRASGLGSEVVRAQSLAALDGVDPTAAGAIIAYEPVWAIGEGSEPAEPGYADGVMATIRAAINNRFSADIPIVYGGSVNENNAMDFLIQEDIDGLFIGRAAWRIGGFTRL